ncbi:MAG: 1-acyl-sn-glycerol-3-phosphate acyltransferase [Cyclobacteriaceae bacterium]|nr:1-acyl-sn-glycerol-3-phosphate acyltransferase [Cyclobacteriaceae bacterium]UYN87951.1 MAG: 1-acyl-sn-glycerol-3-phosphate acyltransferase [Cyclobacteriaceae bacterium]
MLYFTLSIIIRIALKIFFRKITIHGRENIPKTEPLIVMGNHPNTFMDPILAALVILPRQVHFLANGSIFKTAAARLVLNQFNTIPVYRKQDITDNRDEKNLSAFQKCFEFLTGGGILLVFPEGNSINERKLRPIKTGTARIALGVEQQQDFKLPLKLLPIGLNYSNPTRFRESVEINIGKAFDVKNYQQQYQHDPVGAVNALTQEIQQRLAELIVITQDKEADDLVRKIELIYKKQISIDSTLKNLNTNLTQNIVKALHYFQDTDPKLVREVKEKIDSYFATIKEFKVSDYLVEKSEKIGMSKLIRYVLYLISGFPVYITGLLFNYIPFIIPSRIARWISSDEEYRAPIMMTAGIFTFPIYYAIMYILGWQVAPGIITMLVLTVIMPLSGFFVLRYYKRLRNSRSTFAYYRIFKKEKNALHWFSQQRQEIIALLESAQHQYR